MIHIRLILKGVTIMDIAIALASLALITGIAIPVYFSQPRVTLDHAAILLANDLRFAQNEAAISGESTVLEFDEEGDGYAVFYESGAPVTNPVGPLNLDRQYSVDAIFRGVSLRPLEGGPPSFDRHGFLLNEIRVELRYEGETRRLQMERGSGLVSIEGLGRVWTDDGL
ncbi:MAG: hypothetical protein ACI8X5_001688 [Planctomycetota bacterium]|jgi:hypothetical protein